MKRLILFLLTATSLVTGAEVWLPVTQPTHKNGDIADATCWQRHIVKTYTILPDHVIKAVTTDGRILISDRFVVVDKAQKPEEVKKETPGSAAISGKPADK